MTSPNYNPNPAPKVPLFSSSGNVVATVKTDQNGNPYLWKSIDVSRHALRTPPALAFDQTILAEAERMGACYVMVRDRESGHTFRTDLSAFTEHGFRVNRGYGPQVGLAFAFWSESDGNRNLLRPAQAHLDKQAKNKHSASVEAQRPLFDGEGAE